LAITASLGVVIVATSADAQQRSREQCQALADKRGLFNVDARSAAKRNAFMGRCMTGALKKDKK